MRSLAELLLRTTEHYARRIGEEAGWFAAGLTAEVLEGVVAELEKSIGREKTTRLINDFIGFADSVFGKSPSNSAASESAATAPAVTDQAALRRMLAAVDSQIAERGTFVVWIHPDAAVKYDVQYIRGPFVLPTDVVEGSERGLFLKVACVDSDDRCQSKLVLTDKQDGKSITVQFSGKNTLYVSAKDYPAGTPSGKPSLRSSGCVDIRPRDWVTFDGLHGEPIVITRQPNAESVARLMPEIDTKHVFVFRSLKSVELT